ncbi:MAG: pyrrolysine--tRNA(Pyl) ligase large subunit [Deltaproteobacteria bacterium]|nr:pyrrolysine--tRNA(Pyl) ligase large subunit [Deltaproteobacteria bacterium]
MKISWSGTQLKRLREIGADDSFLNCQFDHNDERDIAYLNLEQRLSAQARGELSSMLSGNGRHCLSVLECRLIESLTSYGFVQVLTPIIMSRGLLVKMSISDDHPLNKQIYWIDRHRCLRPMLAPHLYYVSKDLLRLGKRPVRIFEVGPCFRKESAGARHSTEFTMLNLVEWGLPFEIRESRLKELAHIVVTSAGISEYHFVQKQSEVYGETIDVVSDKSGLELGSAAMGPHTLDHAWKIRENWMGIGFGLERLLMVSRNSHNISSISRSLTYLNGIRLNV